MEPLWKKLLTRSIKSPSSLPAFLEVDEDPLQNVVDKYPMLINPYYFSLIKCTGDPIFKQCVPDIREINDEKGLVDPLNEEELSPVPGLTHRYPDRVLFLVSNRCPMYCRFCNRKRKVGRSSIVTKKTIEEGIAYIRGHREIRDVLLSGGDPLLLENEELKIILSLLRDIKHVEIIRIGTRAPCTLPQRITPQLTKMLKEFHPLYILTHFNHPLEITRASSAACERLADAGIPVGCQTVLLEGVNDDPQVIKDLMRKLLTIRVRPYYLFQADLAKGTSHFWTPLNNGLEIVAHLQGHTSGLCLPHFAVDIPGGGGKVPLLPNYIIDVEKDALILKNYHGEKYRYPLHGE